MSKLKIDLIDERYNSRTLFYLNEFVSYEQADQLKFEKKTCRKA